MVVRCLLVALTFLISLTEWTALRLPRRQISFADIPPQLSDWVEQQGFSSTDFSRQIGLINDKTAEREERGEYEHLIYYMLQSRKFTNLPRVEPAISAYEFVKGLTETDRSQFLAERSSFVPSIERMPNLARGRMTDLIKVSRKPGDSDRLSYFSTMIAKAGTSDVVIQKRLVAEYAETMRFLYRKEFSSRSVRPEELAAYVSSLYQNRGHSTDTQIEANYAVHLALASLKAQSPSLKLNRILIVGPGLDVAPRTDLIDEFEPQTYQPFAVADALLSLSLADASKLTIHSVDINHRVVEHINSLKSKKETSLSVLSGIADTPLRPLTPEFKTYFTGLGKSVGSEQSLKVTETLSSHLKKSILVSRRVINVLTADNLNIVTERYEPSPGYDLVVVTNVFPYFSRPELLFALSNIASMMHQDAYLIHNDLQSIPSIFVKALGLPLKEARTVLIASGQGQSLFDGIALHRKEPTSTNPAQQVAAPNIKQHRRTQ